MTQTPSFRRSRDLNKSNKFGQMQELTNDNYSEIKLCSIFRIEYEAIEFSTIIKKKQQLYSRSLYWNDNEAAAANGGFVNKANYVGVITCTPKQIVKCEYTQNPQYWKVSIAKTLNN